MNLRIDSFAASFSYQSDLLQNLVARLENEGYRPLIRRLGQNLCDAVGGDINDLFQSNSELEEDIDIKSESNRRKLLGLEQLGYKWGLDGVRGMARVPALQGELFFADNSDVILFLSMLPTQGNAGSAYDHNGTIRVGMIGSTPDSDLLGLFMSEIASILSEKGTARIEWVPDQLENKEFKEFLQAEENVDYRLANQISERELKSSKALEASAVRDIADLLGTSGVMLAKDLLRQKPEMASDTVKFVDQLIQAELIRQEYVVICSKSGAHVNRVDSREAIDQMSKWGVHCSCGKPIAEEAIEGLLTSDELLHRMIEKNYWLTVCVARALITLGIPAEKVLIVPSAVQDHVELLADVDGSLLMFALKDAEFDMSHAVSFAARIATHRPNVAVLVSTKGVAAEVKDHFRRTKQDSQIVYIPNLLQLDASLKKVIEGVRFSKANSWFGCFESMMNFRLGDLLLHKLEAGRAERPRTATPRNGARATDTLIKSSAINNPVTEQPAEHGFKKPPPKFHLRPERHEVSAPDQAYAAAQSQPAEQPAVISPVNQLPEQLPQQPMQQVQEMPVMQAEPQAFMQPHTMQPHAAYEMPADSEFSNDRPIVDYGVPVYQGQPNPAPAPAPVQYEAPAVDLDAQMPVQHQVPAAPLSDSVAAVTDLEELISEARESRIANDFDLSAATSPAAALQFFSSSMDEDFETQPAAAQYGAANVDANSIIRSVTIAEAPAVAQTNRSLSAMDILDNVLEAVATGDPNPPVAQPVPAGQAPANGMNMAKNEEDELPLATL